MGKEYVQAINLGDRKVPDTKSSIISIRSCDIAANPRTKGHTCRGDDVVSMRFLVRYQFLITLNPVSVMLVQVLDGSIELRRRWSLRIRLDLDRVVVLVLAHLSGLKFTAEAQFSLNTRFFRLAITLAGNGLKRTTVLAS